MKHEINKSNMINDIILTISLIASVITSQAIIVAGDVTENEASIFFILTFVLIKLTYNEFSKIARIYHMKKGYE